MVAQIQKLPKNSKKYNIEYRVYKDVAWYKAWFRNLQPQWGKWEPLGEGFDSLKVINILMEDLEAKKHKLTYKIEYRVTKNIE